MLRPKHLLGVRIPSLFTHSVVHRCLTRRAAARRRNQACYALIETFEDRTLLSGAALGAGNILVSGEIAGTNWLFEYTPDGELIRSFEVPDASFDSLGTEHIRDIAVGPDGLIRIFNGTFTPYVTTLAPFAGTFEHHRATDWSIVNGTGYGKIAVLGEHIFVHDMSTAGSPDKGLVRFDTTDFSATRFGDSHEFLYVTAGFDGRVYGRDATGLMHVFNPITLEKLRTFMVPFGHGAAVAANGDVFTAAGDQIFHYDGEGNLLKTLSTGTSNLLDIDLHPDGRLVASGRFGEIVLTDTTLQSVSSSFSIGADAAFVAFTDALTSGNQPPVAFDAQHTTDEDQSFQGQLSATDANGDPLQYRIVDGPQHGRVELGGDGAFTYTPDADFHGTDAFTFEAIDGIAVGNVATVTIAVSPVDDAPVAEDAFFEIPENSPRGTVVGVVSARDADGDELRYQITSSSRPGAFVIDPHTGRITVASRPALDFEQTPFITLVVTVTSGGSNPLSDTAAVTIGLLDADEGIFVTAAGPGGGPHVRVFDRATGAVKFEFFAYHPGTRGGVHVAVGDVNGDGTPDIVTGAGAGGGPHVRVFDGANGGLLWEFFAYAPRFSGGVHVAVADLNGDGRAEIVTGAGAGGGPHVRVLDGRTGSVVHEFFAYDSSSQGGVFVAAGDLDGDGLAEIVTSHSGGGAALIRIFAGSTGGFLREFVAYRGESEGGVPLAVADLDGDLGSEIIVGAGRGSDPYVRVFDGTTNALMRSLAAYHLRFRGGVRVAAVDLNGDGTADILTGAGPSGGPHVRGFDSLTGAELRGFYAYDPAFGSGVFVAGSLPPRTSESPALLAAGGRVPTAGGGRGLTHDRLLPMIEAALARLEAAGFDSRVLDFLASTEFSIVNLPGALLGLAHGNRILLDASAAGFGWFIDPTPDRDEEFDAHSAEHLTARTTNAAAGIDLLTTVLHEFGHRLGAEHAEGLMSAELAPGVRRLPSGDALDGLFTDDDWLTALSM